MSKKFGLSSMVSRWVFVAFIILGTYNPSGRSFMHWAIQSDVDFSLKLSIGLVLFAANLTLISLTFRSMGYFGVFLMATCLTSIAITLQRLEFVALYFWQEIQLYIIVFFICAITIGICWSSLRTRISGQVDSDDISRRL